MLTRAIALVVSVSSLFGSVAFAEEKIKNTPPLHDYRVEFQVSELEEGKTLSTRSYAMLLRDHESGKVFVGENIPNVATSTRYDIGTSVECHIEQAVLADGFVLLSVNAELSSLNRAEIKLVPTTHKLRIATVGQVALAKPSMVGSVDDPASKHRFQLEATVTKLR